MVRYNNVLSKLMSNIFFRIILCMILMIFGAMFVRFSSSMTSFARNNEAAEANKQSNLSQINDEISYSDLNEVENSIDETNDINDSPEIINEMELSDEQYVVASMDREDEYPKGWLKLFNEKIVLLQKMFPTGKYWNHMGLEPSNSKETNNIYSVTDIPCNHNQYGELYCNAHYGKSDEVYPYDATCSQCRGFASLLSDLVFGEDAPVRYFEDYDELRIGDQARIDEDYHSVFIIDKTDEYVIVAECNNDLNTCQINWGRKILRKDLSGWYISRWSD
ncbi:MAG: hypothetical protein IKQ33_05540 [Clostridia bacterium]|nr:hypothetical protein [Clostridia bacterium]